MLTPQNNKQKTSFNNLLKPREWWRKIGPIPGTKNFVPSPSEPRRVCWFFPSLSFLFSCALIYTHIYFNNRRSRALFLTRRAPAYLVFADTCNNLNIASCWLDWLARCRVSCLLASRYIQKAIAKNMKHLHAQGAGSTNTHKVGLNSLCMQIGTLIHIIDSDPSWKLNFFQFT